MIGDCWNVRSRESCFGAEAEYERQKDAGEDGDEIKGPLPTYIICNFAYNDRGKEGSSEKRQI